MKISEFSKRDTNIVKGFAIIFMLMHHLFYTSSEFCELYQTKNFLLPFSYTVRLGEIGKICVAMFVFLIGYGVAKSMGNRKSFNKNEYVGYTISHYCKLEMQFVFIYIIVAMTSFLGRNVMTVYNVSETPEKRWGYAVIDVLGLQQLFQTPTLNPTWWYMTLAFLYIFITPIMKKIYDRYGFGICVICMLLPYALSMQNYVVIRYLCEITMGIWCAEQKIFEKIKRWNICKNEMGTIFIKLGTSIGTAFLGIYFIYDMKLVIPGEMILTFVLIYFSYEFWSDIKPIGYILHFLGKHSMNIFLVHTMIFYYYFPKHIYSLKYAICILVATLAASCIVSVLIEYLKKWLKFYDVVDLVCDKCVKLIGANNDRS